MPPPPHPLSARHLHIFHAVPLTLRPRPFQAPPLIFRQPDIQAGQYGAFFPVRPFQEIEFSFLFLFSFLNIPYIFLYIHRLPHKRQEMKYAWQASKVPDYRADREYLSVYRQYREVH